MKILLKILRVAQKKDKSFLYKNDSDLFCSCVNLWIICLSRPVLNFYPSICLLSVGWEPADLFFTCCTQYFSQYLARKVSLNCNFRHEKFCFRDGMIWVICCQTSRSSFSHLLNKTSTLLFKSVKMSLLRYLCFLRVALFPLFVRLNGRKI